ncbi:MAG: hypothetical protein ACREH3_01215, partial [Geminicoccales bacterium]
MNRLRSGWERWGGGFGGHLPALVIFTLYSVALTWPLAWKMWDTLVSWGDPVFQTWTMAWNWHALTTDPGGLFDANVFYPWRNVLAYSDHLLGQTLLTAPVYLLTDNVLLADNLAFFMALIFSAMAMYLLVVDLTGNRMAGILAGAAFAFAPPRMAHVEHLHVLSAQWLPLALLCMRRLTLARDMRARLWWAAGLGGCLFAQGLFGIYFLYFLIVMLLVVGAVYLGFAIADRDQAAVEALGMGIVACGLAGLLLVPTLWPYQEVHDDLGFERERAEVDFWSAKRDDYLAAPPTNDLWGSLLEERHRHIEQDLFPGLFLVVFAAVGLFAPGLRRARWVLLSVVVSGIVLSFGLTADLFGREFWMPYQVFYDWLPGFRAIRVPARFGHLALVGLAGLAGLGLDYVWRQRWARMYRQNWRFASAGVLIAGLALIWADTSTTMNLPDPLPVANPRPDYEYVAEHPGTLIELPMGEGPVASAWPNFWSTKHWNQVANGFSGIVPPTYDLLRERSREIPDPEAVRLMQGIGIDYILLHEDLASESRQELEAGLEANPDVALVLPGIDAVYQLERDPWLWRLVEAVPGGETVDLPDISSDPLAYGLLVAILQREGHDVSGNGTIGEFELNEA